MLSYCNRSLPFTHNLIHRPRGYNLVRMLEVSLMLDKSFFVVTRVCKRTRLQTRPVFFSSVNLVYL
jgi:hypothetical protein